MHGLNFRKAFRQQGFTFLEAMITLAIAVIVLTMALPSMQVFVGQSEISATTNQLVYSLQTARSEAIKRASPVALCPSPNSLDDEPGCAGAYADGWIVYADTNRDGDRDVGENVLHQVDAQSPGFTLTADDAFMARVYFGSAGTSMNPSGVPLSGDINVVYADGRESRVVKIAANGRVSSAEKGDGK